MASTAQAAPDQTPGHVTGIQDLGVTVLKRTHDDAFGRSLGSSIRRATRWNCGSRSASPPSETMEGRPRVWSSPCRSEIGCGWPCAAS